MAQPRVRRIAVLTSGGDAPGMNAAIRAVTRRAIFRGLRWSGYATVLPDCLPAIFNHSARATSAGFFISAGRCWGRALRNSRRKPACAACVNLTKRGIEGIVVIGGNGSQGGTHDLTQRDSPLSAWLRPSTTISAEGTSRSESIRHSISRSRRSIA